MKLAVMQPYFFPYLGHFALIVHSDQWIAFDISQYTRHSWINRNRVLHPAAGWSYVSVSLANASTSIAISEARVADKMSTGRSIEGKLSHYRRRAPFYNEVRALVADAFSEATDSLVRLNVRGLRAVCRYLDIPLNLRICSQLNLSLPRETPAGLWALEICARLGADAYLNPWGGRELFDSAAYAERGIALQFLQPPEFRYDTGNYVFEPNLSILDVMMWNRPETIVEAILKSRVGSRRSLAVLVNEAITGAA